jgi:hypothetical protein
MANFTSTGADASGKTNLPAFPLDVKPAIVDGLVQHPLVSPSTQVRVLSIIDETGSATLSDIVAVLPDHPDPVGALMVMVNLAILVVDIRGVLDAHTIVRRADPQPDPQGDSASRPTPPRPHGSVAAAAGSDGRGANSSSSATLLAVNPFSPAVAVGTGIGRRDFIRMASARRPGIYGLMNGTSIYIGMGSDAGQRVASGQQPIERIENIFVITDANGHLTADDARVAERILWSRVGAIEEFIVVNGVPDGIAVDPERFSQIDSFVAQACLALRHAGLLFTDGSARSVLAGPRTEPGRAAPLRPLNQIPSGEILELCFGNGLVALAAQQEDCWVVLQGSDVRPEAATSANASTRYLRAAWMHAGLLAPSHDGRSYTVKRDLVFASGSAASQFCCGSKGRGLVGWQPMDPDGGYDPATAALLAS